MSILVVTVTKDRPKAFDVLVKVMAKQTTKDYDWLVVSDSWAGYKFPKECKVIKRDNADDKLCSICENWLAALEYIEKHDEYDKVIIIEDDDWYNREYCLETATLLDKGDLVGWHEDAYYYVLSRKARRFHNVGHASLAATAFNRSVLPYFRECVKKNDVFIDLLLWHGIRQVSKMQQPPIALASGQVISPPPVEYVQVVSEFNGKKLLADNFTGILWNQEQTIRWEDGKLQVVSDQPALDDKGNIANEHPRRVGMKEPWHGGSCGLSVRGHDPRQGGGPDIFGDKLRDWIGKEDAKLYLQYTKDPPRNPYPANIMIPMPTD